LRVKLKRIKIITKGQKSKEWRPMWKKMHYKLELKNEIKNNETFIKGSWKKNKQL
jgi:hypothetical protein